MHNTIKQRSEHGAYHLIHLQFSFSLLSFITAAGILENSVADLLITVRRNNNNKKWRKCGPRPLSAAEALRQRHGSLHGAEKNPQRRRMPFSYRTARMESDIHLFYVRDFCRRRCPFRAAFVPYVWILSLRRDSSSIWFLDIITFCHIRTLLRNH